MDPRILAALVTSVISQVLLCLLLFPSSTTDHIFTSTSSTSTLFPLILHILSSSELLTSISLLSPSKKRKRNGSFEDSTEEEEEINDEGFTDVDDDRDLEMSSQVPLPHLDSFKLCFRMTSSTFKWLSGLLEPLLECRDPVGSPLNLSPEIRLGIGLLRLATGSGYADISSRFGVSEATSRFCTKQLCRVLCTNFRFWVAFPSPSELQSVSAAFEDIGGIPNCCGVIDCTRFRVAKEGDYQEDSVAAQIVVDSSSRILSVVVGFHGDKGDSRVLKSSTLYRDVEEGKLLNSPPLFLKGVSVPQYLIGDGGYPLLPWLMVPIVDPVRTSCEEDFNVVHHLMRLPALRTIASLRNWGVLSRPIEEEFRTAVAYIGACSILHNVLLMREDYSALCDVTEDFSSYDQSSQYYRDTTSLGENSIEQKACVIQNALSARAKEFRT
ncbi:protein ANTAGONIST OF LIKE HETEROCHROMATIN PROTEIN 1-like [Telopea speciosissima]|uniref:protein ANTAGONIST OF LIKE HETEROCHROMATIN PROTEIN 1-like n=1 Tax=Telopea speciosissima TaxID=54955 RepID=UPI001CC3DFAB|nr:protein ANTAGONIST OF LIKE HETEROCHROMATIN PROTEIN 1-like [Telopea speciosissima]